MVNFAMLHMSTQTLRDNIYTAVYGMISVYEQNKDKKFTEEQIKDMCLKYAEQYTQKYIEQQIDKRASMQ